MTCSALVAFPALFTDPIVCNLTPKVTVELPSLTRDLFDRLEAEGERPEGVTQQLVINSLIEAVRLGAVTAMAEFTAALIERGLPVHLTVNSTPPDDPYP